MILQESCKNSFTSSSIEIAEKEIKIDYKTTAKPGKVQITHKRLTNLKLQSCKNLSRFEFVQSCINNLTEQRKHSQYDRKWYLFQFFKSIHNFRKVNKFSLSAKEMKFLVVASLRKLYSWYFS